MAKMVSFVNYNTNKYHKDMDKLRNDVETAMLSLQHQIEAKEYEVDYAKTIKTIHDLYEAITYEESTIHSILKSSFRGNLTRGIYALILQDTYTLLTEPNVEQMDFSKYLNLVEDKEDIKIEPREYGTKLHVFNTVVNLDNNGVFRQGPSTKIDELNLIFRKLGVVGTYHFFKALLKVVAVIK